MYFSAFLYLPQPGYMCLYFYFYLLSFRSYWKSVLGIRDILVRIRIWIPGSVPLANGSGSGSGYRSNSGFDFNDFKDVKKVIF
jgi:hypothetical protein